MSVMLMLLTVYFGAVVLWAGPRLYRLLRARLLAGRRNALPGCYHPPRHVDQQHSRA